MPKPKICKVCNKPFHPVRITPVCSYICALKWNEKKEIDKRFRLMKQEIQSVKDLEKIAKRVFQAWVRERDKLDPCISCGTRTTEQWDGGHYLKAELYTGLIFHEMNVNKQCCYCNGPHMHANLIEYRKGMIKKYGELAVKGLEEMADKARVYKFTKEELREIIRTYKEKLKQLKTNQI